MLSGDLAFPKGSVDVGRNQLVPQRQALPDDVVQPLLALLHLLRQVDFALLSQKRRRADVIEVGRQQINLVLVVDLFRLLNWAVDVASYEIDGMDVIGALRQARGHEVVIQAAKAGVTKRVPGRMGRGSGRT